MIVFARNLVVKDFWLKLLSAALAILIWLTVKSVTGEGATSPWLVMFGHSPDETVVSVPVRVPTGTSQAFSAQPAEVQVTVRGNSKTLKELSQEIRVQVDLTGIESANGLLLPLEVILPPGLTYTHLSQDKVEVHVSRKPE